MSQSIKILISLQVGTNFLQHLLRKRITVHGNSGNVEVKGTFDRIKGRRRNSSRQTCSVVWGLLCWQCEVSVREWRACHGPEVGSQTVSVRMMCTWVKSCCMKMQIWTGMRVTGTGSLLERCRFIHGREHFHSDDLQTTWCVGQSCNISIATNLHFLWKFPVAVCIVVNWLHLKELGERIFVWMENFRGIGIVGQESRT
jgi:hypothetical protein